MKKWIVSLTLVFFLFGSIAVAEPGPAQKEAIRAAFAEAEKVQQQGPVQVKLADQANLNLPGGYVYIPNPQAAKLMEAFGNSGNRDLVGLVFPTDDSDFMVTVEYIKSGYIQDEDAKNWNVDELFTSLKEGTEEANKERVAKGFPALEIIGWVERPTYDQAKRQLVWSMSARRKGETDPGQQVVNYNTYALGREGYISMVLITNLAEVEKFKPVAAKLLSSTDYVAGKKYEDFNSSTDKVAEYGLAALIAGAAAKKLGFFAVIAGVLAKFGKIILVAVLGGFGALVKLFRRKKTDDGGQE